MSESELNEFPPPPFTPAPLELAERSGCRKGLLFGCGGLFLILALGLVGMVVKAPEIMRAMLGYLEQDYTAKLAPDVPAADRERLHRAFEAARARPLKMEDPAALQEFQAQVLELGAKSQLSRDDAAKLSAVLEKMSGTTSPPAPSPPATPAPAPPAAPQLPPAQKSEPNPAPAPGAGPRPATA